MAQQNSIQEEEKDELLEIVQNEEIMGSHEKLLASLYPGSFSAAILVVKKQKKKSDSRCETSSQPASQPASEQKPETETAPTEAVVTEGTPVEQQAAEVVQNG